MQEDRFSDNLGMNAVTSTILLTGFDAFGDGQANPSEQVALSLDGTRVGSSTVRGLVLPTCFDRAARTLMDRAQSWRKQGSLPLIVCMGLAADRPHISLERVAINCMDAAIADNAGFKPGNQPIVRGAPAAYFSGLDVSALSAALAQCGITAQVSNSAGTFVCNEVFYRLTRRLSRRTWSGTQGGFVHLPSLQTMPLQAQIRAMNQLLAMALKINTTAD